MIRHTAEDRELYNRIVAAHERNMIGLLVNYRKLNGVSSPIFNPWEAIGPLLVPVIVSLLVLIFGGVVAGTMALLFTMLLYGVLLRPWTQRKIHDRARRVIGHSFGAFETLWEFGGFALYITDRPTTMVEAPQGDWRSFVRRNLPKPAPGEDVGAPFRASLSGSGDFVPPVRSQAVTGDEQPAPGRRIRPT